MIPWGSETGDQEMVKGVRTEAPAPGLTRAGEAVGGWGGAAGALMVMLNVPVAVWPAASSTRSVNVKVPAVVGVPEMRPGEACSASPGGNVPAVLVQVYGVVPPSAKTPTA